MKRQCGKYFLIKLKAGALQFTIAFSLLVLMVVLSFLLFHQLRGKELIDVQMNQNLSNDICSATLIMEESPALFVRDPSEFYLHAEFFSDSVHVTVQEWGFYHIATLTNHFGPVTKQKSFLFTDDIHRNKLKPSLYFSDPHRYLSVGGKTFLGHETYLPAYGVRKAYVNGIGYYRDSLIHGTSHQAESELPVLQEKLDGKYSRLCERIAAFDSVISLPEIRVADTIFNSFQNKPLVILCPEEAVLKDICLKGNIVLKAVDLDIRNTATVENCIIIAESVRIEDQFCGSGQFIVTRTISAGDSCRFDIPTVFCSESQSVAGSIHLGRDCFFYGDIIQRGSAPRESEVLAIGENTRMVGQVYCNGTVSFKATLFGSLFCRGFVHRMPNGLYNNYLFNVCIDFERLPPEYGGIALTEEENGKKCLFEVY